MTDAPAAPAPPNGAGLFVSFEGVDGAGKSTQIARAAESLRAAGRPVLATREPGGSPGAEEIRRLLVSGEPGRWSGETELLLFTAARRDHLERSIAPALAAGQTVLCDRYVDSTRAYQAVGRGLERDLIDLLHARLIGRDPDLTLILDLDPVLARARQGRAPSDSGEDRYERLGLDFQRRLRAAFQDIAAAEPARCRLIDASQPADRVAADVRAAIDAASGRS